MTDLATIARQCLKAAAGHPQDAHDAFVERVRSDPALTATALSLLARDLLAKAEKERQQSDSTGGAKHFNNGPISGEGKGVIQLAAGYEHMAVAQAKSLLDFNISPGVKLGDVKRADLIEHSKTLARRAIESEILARWYAAIAERLPVGRQVRQALDHKALKALLDATKPGGPREIEIGPAPLPAGVVAMGSGIRPPTREQLMGGR